MKQSLKGVVVFSSDDFAKSKHIITANCFFFEPLNLEDLPKDKPLAARPARIEVSHAVDEKLHFHLGHTIAFVTSGSGRIRTPESTSPIKVGDVIFIPAGVWHVSESDSEQPLVEHTVFIGDPEDFAAVTSEQAEGSWW